MAEVVPPGAYIGVIKRYAFKFFPLPDMRLNKWSGIKRCLAQYKHGTFFGGIMETGFFYFVKDEFFDNLPGCGLMQNKEGDLHQRPCFYCFQYEGFFWMVPISSKIEKYQAIYDRQIEKRGFCDTIVFGFVNGKRRAFLIQNAFPITAEYISGQYFVEHGAVPVTVNDKVTKELNAAVRKVIRLFGKGIKITLTDIGTIMRFLTHSE